MKADLKGKTIEINGKRYLVLSCTFRQPSARDAAGWALLLLNERGELDQHMVGVDGPIKLIDGPRPVAAGCYADLKARTAVAPPASIAKGTEPEIKWAEQPREMLRQSMTFESIASNPEFREMIARDVIAMCRSEISGAAMLLGDLEREQRIADAKDRAADPFVRRERDPYKRVFGIERGPAGSGTSDGIGPQQPRGSADADRGRSEWSAMPLDAAVRRVQRDPSKPVAVHAIDLSPAVEAAIAEGGKVVQNRPLEVDRNRFLGSVPIGGDGRCTCRGCDTCPLGRRGSEVRCTVADLAAAGHNWHNDKPRVDGSAVGKLSIPAPVELVPDARIGEIWAEAHCGHNAIGHPVELQAMCEELNAHRTAATENREGGEGRGRAHARPPQQARHGGERLMLIRFSPKERVSHE